MNFLWIVFSVPLIYSFYNFFIGNFIYIIIIEVSISIFRIQEDNWIKIARRFSPAKNFEVQSVVSYKGILESSDKYDNLCDENIVSVSLILSNNKNFSNENTYIQKEKIPKDLNIHLVDVYKLILNNEQTEAVGNFFRN